MAYNFKIGELKENALYTVSTIDKWDGSTKTEEMTGASLKKFTNDYSHLYDIHVTIVCEELQGSVLDLIIQQKLEIERLKKQLSLKGRKIGSYEV